MKALILSDIHGNLEALKAVLEASSQSGWREIWFLGDLAGYGPNPEACLELLLKEKTTYIEGNHDSYLAGNFGRNNFSTQALGALLLQRALVKNPFLDFVKLWPTKVRRKGSLLVHGHPGPRPFDYIIDGEMADESFSFFKERICLFGHSHRQSYFYRYRGQIISKRPNDGESFEYGWTRLLANPGSVGQPRDGDNRAAWAIIDTRKKIVEFHRTPYDIEVTQEKMRKMGLSDSLINRLSRGI